MTTLVAIDERLVADAASLAAKTGRTVAEVVEDALREKLTKSGAISEPFRLLPIGTGGVLPGVDLSNNASLLDIMDADEAGKFRNGP